MAGDSESTSKIPSFNPNEDQPGVFQRWERWLRGFELFIISKGVTDATKKKAMLLHHGGFALQDVFYSIPGADTVGEGENAYEVTKTALTNYFKPKLNDTFERHVFRGMAQAPTESIGQYVTRLRQQAKYCSFTSEDTEIRDQIIEKCHQPEVRKRALEIEAATLEDVLKVAKAIEATAVQIKQMEGVTIARISSKDGQTSRKPPNNENRCLRCGYTGHLQSDPKCPARGKECNKCKKKGHFAKWCKSQVSGDAAGRPPEHQTSNRPQRRHRGDVREVDDTRSEDDESEYAFALSVDILSINAIDDRMVTAIVGKVPVKIVIDSGASCNIIDEDTWNECKKKKIICQSNRGSNKKVYAYGQVKQLILLGEFFCEVTVGKKTVEANFLVLAGKGKPLLGCETALKLGILKIGRNAQIDSLEIVKSNRKLFEGIGKLKDVKLKLNIDPDHPPVAQPVRRTPLALQDKMKKAVDDLIRLDIVEVVDGPTPWVSPVVPIEKKNGGLRICVDMRVANQAIIRERYPLPVWEDLITKVAGAKVFSTLDANNAYYQIELDEPSRLITTFGTSFGTFRFKRRFFGVNSAPEKFQQLMVEVLKGLDGVINFFDDFLVFGNSKEQHAERLQAVLQRLEEKGLTLNKEKCRFAQTKVTFLGYSLSGEGIRPMESKIEAVESFRHPQTAEEIRSFLGLVNFNGQFIPDLATISEPLRRLTRKSSKFNWGKEQEAAFKELKGRLSRAETLGIFDIKAKTRVIADASPVGLGAVLTQWGPTGWRVICYGNRGLSDCERRYSQTEKEALALVWACERFHYWLYGREFELVTDHKALECIFGTRSKPCARIERWVLRLQDYNYKIKYEKGSTNIADPLSRLMQSEKGATNAGVNVENYINAVILGSIPRALSRTVIAEESEKDPFLIEVRKALSSGNWQALSSSKIGMLKDELCACDSIVLRGTRIVIPKSLQAKVLGLAHEGHPGIVAMKARLRAKVWWDNIDKDTENFVKVCKGCQLVQKSVLSNPITRNQLPQGPWQSLAMDLLGPFPSGEEILVLVDYYSRFFEVEIMRTTTASAVIARLRVIFARFGYPNVIVCDNGPPFNSQELENFAETNGFNIAHSTPLWPQGNGEVERQNRSLLKRLKIAHADGKSWKDELYDYLLMYRSTPHSVTGKTPSELLFSRNIKCKLPEFSTEVQLDEEVRERDSWQKAKGKISFDTKNNVKDTDVSPGDSVLVKQPRLTKLTTEFNPTPFKVTDRHNNTVTITSPQGVSYKRNVTHVKKLFENPPNAYPAPNTSGTAISESVEQYSRVENSRQSETPSAEPRRSARAHKAPEHLKDYVLT